MTKKQVCMAHAPIATMGLTNTSGIAIHHIEYGIDDHIYASFSSGDVTTYHKCKLYSKTYNDGHTNTYFYIGGLKLFASDFIRV